VRKNYDIGATKTSYMRSLYLFVCCIFALPAFSQKESPYTKFGKIPVSAFQTKIYPIDSSADAVVLSDIGTTDLEGNNKGWFSLVSRRHKVVHILNKNGYNEANVQIPLYVDGNEEERLDNVKAVTYNLENGKIVESKLDKGSIFKEKIDKKRMVKKFTMPNVKEGCIIEYEYQVTSDFISNLDPWLFQSETAPQLWSEFTFSVPQFFSYNFLSRGYHPIYINERKDRNNNFAIQDSKSAGPTDRYSFTAGVTDYRWVMKDVPKLKEESFTSSIRNHISRIEFQLASQSHPLSVHNYRTTWNELTKSLLESEYFGSVLKNNNNWLSDDVKPVFASVTNGVEKARKIYAYVRDNFSCTGNSGHIYLDQTLKNVFKAKKGSVAEINLLLTAMLRYAGLDATPVILSTARHGYAIEYSPMTSSFNYVVVQYNDNDKLYYLDASDPQLGFNKLPSPCYNGHARLVNEMAAPVYFSADSLKEAKATLLLLANNEKGKWSGQMKQAVGYYESYDIRERIKEKGKEDFFKQIQKDFGSDVKITEPAVDSLMSYDNPIMLRYAVEIDPGEEDILYVNPMFGEAYRKNWFSAAERFYPVEMPYAMDETFVLTMEVPKGYAVDELPKQMLAKFDEEGNSFFEYRISHSENIISFRSRVKIARAFFLPEEYQTLREFFNLIVSKQSEQIVFKKKK
jgi:transglutaminase-like putative cysteine protease